MDGVRLVAARRRRIVDLVQGRGSVAVQELSQELGVSTATIRRDLRKLDGSGVVTRTHGGVVNNSDAFVDLPNEERLLIHSDAKSRIGLAAIERLSGNETVFLDAGTTGLAVSMNAHLKPYCRYVTTCLRIASSLRDQQIPNFYLIGGSYISVNDSFGGQLTIASIRSLSFDVSFLCCSAIDLERCSISIGDEEYSQVHAEVVLATHSNILVAHHEKFAARSFIHTASLDDIECVITDQALEESVKHSLAEAQIEVVLA